MCLLRNRLFLTSTEWDVFCCLWQSGASGCLCPEYFWIRPSSAVSSDPLFLSTTTAAASATPSGYRYTQWLQPKPAPDHHSDFHPVQRGKIIQEKEEMQDNHSQILSIAFFFSAQSTESKGFCILMV